MPWSKTNLPPAASKLKGHEQAIFIAAANAALKQYKDDVRAIRTGLAAVNDYRNKKKTMQTKQAEFVEKGDVELTIDVEEAAKSGLLQKVVDSIVQFFLQDEVAEDTQEIADANNMLQSFTQKSVNEELRQATFIVLEPETADAHGDVYSADEIRKACHNFNLFCRKAYLNHAVETDKMDFVESYIAPDDMVVNGFAVQKGTWLAVTQFNDNELWDQVKSDGMTGLSIGAMANAEELK